MKAHMIRSLISVLLLVTHAWCEDHIGLGPPPASAATFSGVLAPTNGGSGIANTYTASWTGWTGNDSIPGLGQANTFSGVNTFSNSTASANYYTGALILSNGGLGVAGNINANGTINSNANVFGSAVGSQGSGTGAWTGYSSPFMWKTSGAGSYPFNQSNALAFQCGNASSIVGGGFYFGVGNGSTATTLVCGIGGATPPANNMPTVQLWGRNNGGSDVAGAIGETITGTASAVALAPTGTCGNLTSASLTAGKWLVSGWVTFDEGATGFTAGSVVDLSIVSTSATNGTEGATMTQDTIQTLEASGKKSLNLPAVIVNISATTTYYLTAQATFGGGSPTASGLLTAQRLP